MGFGTSSLSDLRRAEARWDLPTALASRSVFLFDDGLAVLLDEALLDLGWDRQVPREFHGELRLALGRRLLAAAGEKKSRPDWSGRAGEVRAAQERHRQEGLKLEGAPIDPRRAQMALAKVLPKDAILTTDAGSAASYIYEYQRFERPRSILAPQDLAAIGVGYPLGLGAKLACPDAKASRARKTVRAAARPVCISHSSGDWRAGHAHGFVPR